MAKRAKAKDDYLSHAMLNAVAAYLEANGWSVALVGGTSVQQQPHERKFNFEFVVKFTGAKRDSHG